MSQFNRAVKGLFTLGAIVLLGSTGSAIAQTNSRPSIFNESPYNRSPRSLPATPSTPPLPEERQAPSAVVQVTNGAVNIKLVNNTGAEIVYQVIGDTQLRTLAGRSNTTLQTLKIPTTLTFYRKDRGLLLVNPKTDSTTPGTLEVGFTEATDFSADKTTLVVEESGQVYLN